MVAERASSMGDDLLSGRFAVRSGGLARFNPRIKLLLFLIIAVAIMITLQVEVYLLLSAALLLALLLTLQVWRRLPLLVLPLMLMIILTSALHIIFVADGGKIVTTVAGIDITANGLNQALLFSWRLVLFVVLAVLFTVSVSPDEFAQVVWRGLSRLGMALAGLGAAFYLAIRFLPELVGNYRQIKMAQQARGAEFSGGLIRRTSRSLPLLVPVVVAALRKATSLSDCLTVRGWGAAPRRSFYPSLRLNRADWLLFLLGLLLLAAIAILIR